MRRQIESGAWRTHALEYSMTKRQTSLEATLLLGIAAMAVSRVAGLPEFAFVVSTGVMLIAAAVGTIWSFLQVDGYRRSIGLSIGIFLCCTAPWIIQTVAFPAIVGLFPILAIWLTAALIAAASYALCETIAGRLYRAENSK
jgi:hypothetical protein